MRRHPAAAALPFSVRLGGPHPTRFGLGRRWMLAVTEALPEGFSEEARLFASTWLAGFLAFSLYLA
jgi:hypothetical protein